MPAAAEARGFPARLIEILRCPRDGGEFRLGEDSLDCTSCDTRFAVSENIPRLYWPNEWDSGKSDATDDVRAFYEATPFPNYDDFDSVASLVEKARRGLFAKMLDDQVPPGARILECGCGTGQLSNLLAVANRNVVATDICLNSLRLGEGFRAANNLERVGFLQMNLFRPAFAPESFDLVISNGVLHHTSDPHLAFKSIASLVKPGGYVLFGLYHRYGRLITDLRRLIFRLSNDRFTWLDPNLRDSSNAAKKRAWFLDQYKHPIESKHTFGESLGWLEEAGFSFSKSIPRSVPFKPFKSTDRLFEPEAPGNWLERGIVQLGMVARGSREGGFFIIIGQKRL